MDDDWGYPYDEAETHIFVDTVIHTIYIYDILSDAWETRFVAPFTAPQ